MAVEALESGLDVGTLRQIGGEGILPPHITGAAPAVHGPGVADAGPAAAIAAWGVGLAEGVRPFIGRRFEVAIVARGVAQVAGAIGGRILRRTVGHGGAGPDRLFILAEPHAAVLRTREFFAPLAVGPLVPHQPLGRAVVLLDLLAMATAAGLLGDLRGIGQGFPVAVVPFYADDLFHPGLFQLFGIALGEHAVHAAPLGRQGLQGACRFTGERLALQLLACSDQERTQHPLVGRRLILRLGVAQVAVHAGGLALHVHFLVHPGGVQIHRLRPQFLHLPLIAVTGNAARPGVKTPGRPGRHQHQSGRRHHSFHGFLLWPDLVPYGLTWPLYHEHGLTQTVPGGGTNQGRPKRPGIKTG